MYEIIDAHQARIITSDQTLSKIMILVHLAAFQGYFNVKFSKENFFLSEDILKKLKDLGYNLEFHDSGALKLCTWKPNIEVAKIEGESHD